jgi:hypothetical protein
MSHTIAAAALIPLAVIGSPYEKGRASAIKACQAVDPGESQSGLYFNPEGYQSYYLQSKCFQDAAVRFRDVSLCAHVRQRRALLSSSWGYSRANCRKLVDGGVAADRRELEAMKAAYAGAVRLRDFRVESNGNGRDFDIIPSFTEGKGHGYTIDVEILPAGEGRPPVLIHSSGYYVDPTSRLSIFVTSAEIRRRMPEFAAGRRYRVRLTATYSVPERTMSAEWSPAFVEQVFPERERVRSVTKEIEFGRM